MKLRNLAVISSCSCCGVLPVACNSPTKGNVIFPSDRTVSDRERSGSFHTLIANTSSAPIMNLSHAIVLELLVTCTFVLGDTPWESGEAWGQTGTIVAAEIRQNVTYLRKNDVVSISISPKTGGTRYSVIVGSWLRAFIER